jgi:hypothetical protein
MPKCVNGSNTETEIYKETNSTILLPNDFILMIMVNDLFSCCSFVLLRWHRSSVHLYCYRTFQSTEVGVKTVMLLDKQGGNSPYNKIIH